MIGFVSGEGHLAAKLEASYDLLITQRLILQPQVELNVHSQGGPRRAWSAPVFPTSIPACGCVTNSAANSRPSGIPPQPGCALCQRSPPARHGSVRGGHSRIRDGARVQSQLGERNSRYRQMQDLYRADRGGDPACGASHPPQSPRSWDRLLVFLDWAGTSAAIAHRRGDRMARKSPYRQSGIRRPSRGTEGLQTRRWRELDSNPRSPASRTTVSRRHVRGLKHLAALRQRDEKFDPGTSSRQFP